MLRMPVCLICAVLAGSALPGCGGSNEPATTTTDAVEVRVREETRWRERFGADARGKALVEARVAGLTGAPEDAGPGRRIGSAFFGLMERAGGFDPEYIAGLAGEMTRGFGGPACRAGFESIASAVKEIAFSQPRDGEPEARRTVAALEARSKTCPTGG